jgi:hypothetical protein
VLDLLEPTRAAQSHRARSLWIIPLRYRLGRAAAPSVQRTISHGYGPDVPAIELRDHERVAATASGTRATRQMAHAPTSRVVSRGLEARTWFSVGVLISAALHRLLFTR